MGREGDGWDVRKLIENFQSHSLFSSLLCFKNAEPRRELYVPSASAVCQTTDFDLFLAHCISLWSFHLLLPLPLKTKKKKKKKANFVFFFLPKRLLQPTANDGSSTTEITKKQQGMTKRQKREVGAEEDHSAGERLIRREMKRRANSGPQKRKRWKRSHQETCYITVSLYI